MNEEVIVKQERSNLRQKITSLLHEHEKVGRIEIEWDKFYMSRKPICGTLHQKLGRRIPGIGDLMTRWFPCRCF